MTRISFLAIFLLMLGQTAGAATQFERIADTFANAAAPTHAAITGVWAGRCTDNQNQDTLTPAVLIEQVVSDPQAVPPNHPSMTYYTEAGDPALFDNMTPDEIESYPAIRDWLKREQWQPVTTQNGSLVNNYTESPTVTVQRAARLYTDEFNRMVVLQVSRLASGQAAQVTRYCYFNKNLGEPTSSVALLWGETGKVSDQDVTLANPNPTVKVSGVNIVNNGDGNVWLRNVTMTLADGTVAQGPRLFRLPAGATLTLSLGGSQAFQIQSVQFNVLGTTSNLQLRSVPVQQTIQQ